VERRSRRLRGRRSRRAGGSARLRPRDSRRRSASRRRAASPKTRRWRRLDRLARAPRGTTDRIRSRCRAQGAPCRCPTGRRPGQGPCGGSTAVRMHTDGQLGRYRRDCSPHARAQRLRWARTMPGWADQRIDTRLGVRLQRRGQHPPRPLPGDPIQQRPAGTPAASSCPSCSAGTTLSMGVPSRPALPTSACLRDLLDHRERTPTRTSHPGTRSTGFKHCPVGRWRTQVQTERATAPRVQDNSSPPGGTPCRIYGPEPTMGSRVKRRPRQEHHLSCRQNGRTGRIPEPAGESRNRPGTGDTPEGSTRSQTGRRPAGELSGRDCEPTGRHRPQWRDSAPYNI
jgi:hypothetical protein